MKQALWYKLLPKAFRNYRLKNQILAHLDKSNTFIEEAEFILENGLSVFPYEFSKKYKAEYIKIEKDPQKDLLYTILDGKKLYYKNGNQVAKAKSYFNSLLLEQDPASAHCYLSPDFKVTEGDILCDIGAAEGNFSLLNIEKLKKVYLFEVEPDWIKALNATFEPYKDKVEIVKAYVGETTTAITLSLDHFLKEKELTFIKADVEGAELAVLKGAQNLISRSKNLKIAVTTYHNQNDPEVLETYLQSQGLKTHFSDKHMLFTYGKENIVEPPYLRKGILRGEK